MRNKILLAAMMAVAMGVTGCASVPMAAPEADAKAKTYKPDPGKANVFVYRNENMGAAVKMPVLLDNVSVGDTAANTYIYRQVGPGSHTITSKTEKDDSLTINAKAGANYFIWQEVKMGAFAARSKLHLVDEVKGKKGVEECKLVK